MCVRVWVCVRVCGVWVFVCNCTKITIQQLLANLVEINKKRQQMRK